VKLLVRRARADEDVREAIAYYLQQSPQTALAFVDELERAYGHIERQPGAGSLRYAYELSLPGLRFRPVRRFPYLVFYMEREREVEAWRVLHGNRDIPSWLAADVNPDRHSS
jgi:toxin ParE1/3/4